MNSKFLPNLLAEDWHIDLKFAQREYSNLLNNLALIEAGVPMSDIFSEMKKESGRVKAIDLNDESYYDVEDITNIKTSTILELSFSGTMRNEDGLCSYGINSLVEKIYAGYANPNVKAILLNMNSGGGYSSSGYNLQSAVADKNKPFVVRTPFLGSAAVNGTAPATEIIGATEAAEIGSIGTYLSINTKALKEYVGEFKDIYSRVSPDKNKDIRAAFQGDFSLLEDYVTDNAKMFQKSVSKYRPLNEKLMESTLAGAMFMAADAKKRGLIDSIGSRTFALKRINSHIKYFKQ